MFFGCTFFSQANSVNNVCPGLVTTLLFLFTSVFDCFLFTLSVVSSQRLVMQERRERNHEKKMETPLVFNGP